MFEFASKIAEAATGRVLARDGALAAAAESRASRAGGGLARNAGGQPEPQAVRLRLDGVPPQR